MSSSLTAFKVKAAARRLGDDPINMSIRMASEAAWQITRPVSCL